MGKTDGRNRLGVEPFSYRVAKDGRVRIAYEGREVAILGPKDADRFLAAVADADTTTLQLLMAKLTGNFKRGNEHRAKRLRDHHTGGS